MGGAVTAAIGYAAFALNVAGNLMLARKNIAGWLVRLATNVVWIIYAVQVEGGLEQPMALNHITFFGINIYGWWHWSQAKESP